MSDDNGDHRTDDQPDDKGDEERSPRRTFNIPDVDTSKMHYYAPYEERLADFKKRGIVGTTWNPDGDDEIDIHAPFTEEELEAANEEARRQGYEDGADEDEDEDE